MRGWRKMTWVAVIAIAACGGSGGGASAAAAGTCKVPLRSYGDMQACTGTSEQIELSVADNRQGKTVGRIAIASRDPDAILGAMGAYAIEWSGGADSFTVFAYGDVGDYAAGSPYNRGRLYWNDGGTIMADICTEFSVAEDGIDSCDDETSFTFPNL